MHEDRLVWVRRAERLVLGTVVYNAIEAGVALWAGLNADSIALALACAYLSLVLFFGLAANAWLGWWWADAVGALLMVPWLVREGRENLSED